MNDEQLLELSKEEAKNRLEGEELERYNELKQQELEKGLEQKKKQDSEDNRKALKSMIEASRRELTTEVDIGGISLEVFVDPDIEDFSKLKKLQSMKDEKIEDLSKKQVEELRSDMIELLAKASTNYSQKDWQTEFEDAGLNTVLHITGKVFNKIDEDLKQKKSL